MDKEEDSQRPPKYSWQGIKSPEQLTEPIAWQLFKTVRWRGEKPKCVYCGDQGLKKIKHRGLYSCRACKRKFTDRHGTPYFNVRVSMKTMIFFTILLHGGIPINRLHKVLGISKTAALRFSLIVKKCAIAKEILKRVREDTSLTVVKIIYYLAPDFDSTFKYGKKYHSELQLAQRDCPRCRTCGSYDVQLLNALRRTLKCRQCLTFTHLEEFSSKPGRMTFNPLKSGCCVHGVSGGCRRCFKS